MGARAALLRPLVRRAARAGRRARRRADRRRGRHGAGHAPPGLVVERLDELVCHLGLADLTTLVYAVLDPASRRVAYANAGHLPPIVVAPGRAPALLSGARGTPLGAGVGAGGQAIAELPPDGTLLLYTDGLVEERGRSPEEGIERLATIAGAWDGRDLPALCDEIVAAVHGDRDRPDDIALLAVALR